MLGTTCIQCGHELGPGTNFCPYCGASQQPYGSTPSALSQVPPQIPPQVPAYAMAGPYPMGTVPMPMHYNPVLSPGRMSAVAGSIIGLIDGIMALLFAFIVIVDAFFILLGVMLLASFAFNIVTVIAVFRHWRPQIALVGPILLVVGGLGTIFGGAFFFLFVGIIGLTLGAISLGLIAAGWRDMTMRAAYRRGYGTMYGQPHVPPMMPMPPPYSGP